MLNTDRHNPGVKVKMTLEDFLRNNRGINGAGGDLDPARHGPKGTLLGATPSTGDGEELLD